MAKAKSNLEKLFRIKMVEQDIDNYKELSRRSGIDYQRLQVRLKDPGTLRMFEVKKLMEVLGLTTEEICNTILN